jgi:hypothetical protein
MMKTSIAKLDFVHAEALGALANGSLVRLLLKCPVASASFTGAWLKVCASVFGTTGSGSSLIEVVETPTTSVDGTARTPQCTSRLDTPPASSVPVFLNTEATGGTALDRGDAQVGQSWESSHWLLKPATNYLVRLTNQSGGALVNGTLKLKLSMVSANISDYLRIYGG